MNTISSQSPAVVVGNGTVSEAIIATATAHEHILVAADGGARKLREIGREPQVIVGDMDSIGDRGLFPDAHIIPIEEQDSSDLQKCLRTIDAPFFLCTGFVGSRYDHSLMLPHVFLSETEKLFLFLEGDDIIFRVPDDWTVTLPPATRISLYPLKKTCARSSGLLYELDDVDLTVGACISTSNQIEESPVHIVVDNGALMGIAPIEHYIPIASSLSCPYFLSCFSS